MTEKQLYNTSKGQRANSWLTDTHNHSWKRLTNVLHMFGQRCCKLCESGTNVPRFSFTEGLVVLLWEHLSHLLLQVHLSSRDLKLMPCRFMDWVKQRFRGRALSLVRELGGASLSLNLPPSLSLQCWSLINISHPRFHLHTSQHLFFDNPACDMV